MVLKQQSEMQMYWFSNDLPSNDGYDALCWLSSGPHIALDLVMTCRLMMGMMPSADWAQVHTLPLI